MGRLPRKRHHHHGNACAPHVNIHYFLQWSPPITHRCSSGLFQSDRSLEQELDHAKAQWLDAQRNEKLTKVDLQQLEKRVRLPSGHREPSTPACVARLPASTVVFLFETWDSLSPMRPTRGNSEYTFTIGNSLIIKGAFGN